LSGELPEKKMMRAGLFVLLVASCSSTFVRLVVLFDSLRTLLLLLLLKKGEGKFVPVLQLIKHHRI
jgi:hypothetical protein